MTDNNQKQPRRQKVVFTARMESQAIHRRDSKLEIVDRITSPSENRLDLVFRPGALRIYDVLVDDQRYMALQGLKVGERLTDPGAPLLPQEGLFIGLPAGATGIEIQVQEAQFEKAQQGLLMPVPEPTPRIEGHYPSYHASSDFYGQNQWPPENDLIQLDNGALTGNNPTAIIRIALACCYPEAGEFSLLRELRFSISFTRDEAVAAVFSGSVQRPTAFQRSGHFLQAFPEAGIGVKSQDQSGQKGSYLIIAPESLQSSLQPFLKRKKKQYGGSCSLVTVESLSSDSGLARAEDIRRYLQEAYTSWAKPPEQVLLVGGYADIPFFPEKYETGGMDNYEPIASDHKYCDLSGDLYPDIAVTRIPFSDEKQVLGCIAAASKFEKAGKSWCQNALLIASDDSRDQESMNLIQEKLHGREYKTDRLGEEDSADKVKTNLEAGRAFTNYSGHGSGPSWCTTNYDVHDVEKTVNLDFPPGIISISCLTNCLGDFGGFGLGLGPKMVAENKAAWFVSGTRPTFFGSGEAMNQYFIDALLDGKTASEAYIIAKIEILRNYGGTIAQDDVRNYTFWGVGDMALPTGTAGSWWGGFLTAMVKWFRTLFGTKQQRTPSSAKNGSRIIFWGLIVAVAGMAVFVLPGLFNKFYPERKIETVDTSEPSDQFPIEADLSGRERFLPLIIFSSPVKAKNFVRVLNEKTGAIMAIEENLGEHTVYLLSQTKEERKNTLRLLKGRGFWPVENLSPVVE